MTDWRIIPVLAAASLSAQAQPERPDDQIIDAFVGVVDAVAERRSDMEQNICISFDLVDRFIGAQFDFESASLVILRGEHWPEDQSEQDRFVSAFYDSLVADYGDLLIHFDSETLTVARLQRNPDTNPFWLDTVLRFNDGTTADVRFRMYYNGDRWGIIDVRADTLLYSKDFRAQFLEHIFEHGYQSLVAELERKAARRRQCTP